MSNERMEKQMKNKEKGITLIALIITIIVMLILVGVTINVALNGGLFDKAKTASDQTQRQVSKEQLIAAMVGAYDSNGNFVVANVELPEGATWCTEEETDYESALETATAERNWVITENGNKFYVDSKGTVYNEKPQEEPETPVGETRYNVTIGNLNNITWSSISGLEGGKSYSINFEDENGNVSILGVSTNEYLTESGGTYVPNSSSFDGALVFDDENNVWKNQENQSATITISNVTYSSGGTFLGTTFDELTDAQIKQIITIIPVTP